MILKVSFLSSHLKKTSSLLSFKRLLRSIECGRTITFSKYLSTNCHESKRNINNNISIKENKTFKDRIYTIPNLLCGIRILSTPLIGYLVIYEAYQPACILFILAGVTDFLDGFIARHWPSQRSLFGSIIDPVADKFLVSVLFVTLTYSQLIPWQLTTLVLSRDISLIIGGFIKRYQILQKPVTFKRFFDPSVDPVKMLPTFISKINTTLQLSLVAFSLAAPIFDFTNHPALTALCWITAYTTVHSGLQYIGGKAMKKVNPKI
ncbi:Cardiolipin synthase [Strongyloides ratti]|uniref:cardiolipin synthase (CMP-forming) n=1 Tax=Strongyloides ratti TaxID=34506 RepID=A0A090L3K2_STRRB|nr:Cardiolipin synthase [Strongyloides ratti]CEF62069.1 Cardiolipin synthase [Strongyloides ratti]